MNQIEYLNYIFKVGHFFGLNNEDRFYKIVKVANDYSLIVDVFKIKDNKAYKFQERSDGYNLEFFKNKIKRLEIWTDSTPKAEIISEIVKKEKKVQKKIFVAKPVKSTLSASQGTLF